MLLVNFAGRNFRRFAKLAAMAGATPQSYCHTGDVTISRSLVTRRAQPLEADPIAQPTAYLPPERVLFHT